MQCGGASQSQSQLLQAVTGPSNVTLWCLCRRWLIMHSKDTAAGLYRLPRARLQQSMSAWELLHTSSAFTSSRPPTSSRVTSSSSGETAPHSMTCSGEI